MERIELQYTGSKTARNRALSGVVGSGDMEALFEPGKGNKLSVSIKTSVDGSTPRWGNAFSTGFPSQAACRRENWSSTTSVPRPALPV